MARPKRKDKTRTVLRTGELQRSDGSYQYSWTDENHKRRYVYSKTLEALRIKEEHLSLSMYRQSLSFHRQVTMQIRFFILESVHLHLLLVSESDFVEERKRINSKN